jgi:nicotinate dehydrogenase subunit A
MRRACRKGLNLLEFTLNGRSVSSALRPDAPLLSVLRNDFALNGPKYGCGLGECGACTILIDGVAARSCILPLRAAEGRTLTTLEGLSRNGRPGPVQRAFIEAQAAQCGYCLNGMILTAAALLARNPDPSEAEIRAELRHNLCRCGTHVEILAAVRLAAVYCRAEAVAGP